ncbi:MAG: dsbC [Ramlibacter sp.]|nr:dsbC [Ramlibacter sp.]
MKLIHSALAAALLAAGLAAGVVQAQAPTQANAAQQEATLRKNLEQRLPALGKIDEVRRSPLPGLFEVRVGTDLYYADADGNNLIINGQILDTKTKRNLTEERQEKLLAVDFDALPVKDAFTIVRGNGKRKLAVFEDPNCGYCKRFERDLQKIDNVTVYMYLFPILGPDSVEKSRNHWCVKDKGRAWQDWMVRNDAAPKADAGCDVTALARNVELGKKHKITGTPTLIFTDGTRVPGAIGAADVEKLLASK